MLPQSIHLNLAITRKELEISKQKNLVQKLKELKKTLMSLWILKWNTNSYLTSVLDWKLRHVFISIIILMYDSNFLT